jgi:hypothetical protein
MTATLKKYLFLIGSAITIFINYLAVALPINNVTTAQVSDKFFTTLTPAGFTFGIWGLIYGGLVVISFLIITNQYKISDKGLGYFLLSCLANCLWIFSWQYFHLLICAILLLVLVFANYKTYEELNKVEKSTERTIITSWYLIYLGWTIVASIINITSFLQYDFNFGNLVANDQATWGVIVLFVGLAINLVFSLKKQNITTLMVFFWALLGIQAAQTNTILNVGIDILYFLVIFSTVLVLLDYNKEQKEDIK